MGQSTFTPRWIALAVGLIFFAGSLVIFRDVLTAIPAILRGDAVISGDELVPFFTWHSQLLDQAAGQFNDLVNGYEFRVRYSFLTTWMRYYAILPFAILLVIPAIFWVAYLAVARFISRVFTSLSSQAVYLATFFPVSVIYLIMVYAKITHFYTLILGLVMMTVSSLWMLYGVLFAGRKWKRYIVGASLLALLNPAVHYLILFSLFFALTVLTLAVGGFVRWLRNGGPARLREAPSRLRGLATDAGGFLQPRARTRTIRTAAGRSAAGFLLHVVLALVPYALFAKYIVLAGVPDLTDTVPSDFYSVQDSSVPWLHAFSWDLAGIMDKILFGDYLAAVPRYSGMAYLLLLLVPFVVPAVRRRLFSTRPLRQLLAVLCVAIGFALWATIGYADPSWFPTFHRTLAALATFADQSNTALGDLFVTAAGAVVQVLRFPHRFQLLLFMLAPLVLSLVLALAIDALSGFWARTGRALRSAATAGRGMLLKLGATACVGLVFLVPFFSGTPYGGVFASGDLGGFLAPLPLDDLQGVKKALDGLPEGRTVVLPPAESGKLVADSAGVDHKLNDKFFIYYLDEPSYYYGLTGDVTNKFAFFLLLRGLYYHDDWWINTARDLGIRYIVVNRGVHSDSDSVYLPHLESSVETGLKAAGDAVTLRYANTGYALYELTDQPQPKRQTLLVDSSWQSYLDLVYSRRDLSRCYHFEYTPYYDPASVPAGEPVQLLTDDAQASALDLYLLEHPEAIAQPDARMFPFDPSVVSSSYYLSPMFRSFSLLSNTKWNRTGMITPGVFGTLRGSFVGVPGATTLSVPVTVPTAGRYRVLARTADTANSVRVTAPALGYDRSFELRSPSANVKMYAADSVYTDHRVAIDTSGMSVKDLEGAIPKDVVPVTNSYGYQDLGVVDAAAGTVDFTIDKTDTNPMLFEGLMLVPEDTYQSLTLPAGVTPITNPDTLGCSERTTEAGATDGGDAWASPMPETATPDTTAGAGALAPDGAGQDIPLAARPEDARASRGRRRHPHAPSPTPREQTA